MNLPLLPPADLLRASQIAVELSIPVPTVPQLAAAAGVSQVLSLDGMPYFASEDFERLAQRLHHDSQQLALARLN